MSIFECFQFVKVDFSIQTLRQNEKSKVEVQEQYSSHLNRANEKIKILQSQMEG